MKAARALPVFQLLVGLAAGCSASNPRARAPAPPVAPDGATAAATAVPPASAALGAAPPAPLAPNALPRSRVHAVLERGLGAFLQRVSLAERPVRVGGKFRGFQIVELRPDRAFWRGVDLLPGDVVTRVNGFPIERPEQALEAFRSLDVASELRVDYERDGAPRSLRYAIVDDAAPPRAP